jgi:competence ComEA-like helix-hairpin-helix protein
VARAREAPPKAREAEAAAATSLGSAREVGEEPPPVEPEPVEPESVEPESVEPSSETEAPTPPSDPEGGGGILGRTVGAILGSGPGREADEGDPDGTPQDESEGREIEQVELGDRTSLNSATFEELRDLGFSVTQATRVITYRERQQGFKSVDDLASVPGMPPEFVSGVKDKLTL